MKLFLDLIEGLAMKLPMAISASLLNVVKPQMYRRRGYVLFGSAILFALLALGFLLYSSRYWSQIRTAKQLLTLALLCYGGCVIVSLPCFLLYSYLKQFPLLGGLKSDRKITFTQAKVAQGRERAGANRIFLGRSMESKRNVFLSTEMRRMHTHVVGSTGTGKTDSVILPMLVQDIQRGRGALVMDAKGDMETLNKIIYHVRRTGREKDFLFFSLAYPEKSNTYNPLLRGNPTELKDKIISANIWTEEFYKKKSEETLLLLMKALREAGQTVTFHKLYELLSDEEKLVALSNRLKDLRLKGIIDNALKKYALFQKDLSGLTADLGMIAESEFAHLLVQEKSQIDLLDAYLTKKIVYFQLNAQGYEETARRFGRIVLQDLKTVSNHIQAYLPEEKRSFFPVFVDEFSNFAYEQFVEFLNKARGAHLGITIAHQSLGDLQKAGDYFMKQILENCNIKIVMRQDDPESIEIYARISGTVKSMKNTVQTEEDLFGKSPTGMGTVREVEEFRLKPNTIRGLGRGEAGLIIKQPYITDLIQLDYIGHVPPVT